MKEQIQNLPFPSLHQKCCGTLEGEFLYIVGPAMLGHGQNLISRTRGSSTGSPSSKYEHRRTSASIGIVV